MNELNGFIILDRKMLKWEWYQDTNTKILFLHCLLKANWKDGKFQGIKIPRGSFVTSLKKLSEELSANNQFYTVQNVRTSLNHLISTNEITNKSFTKFRIITVNNYDKYQDLNKYLNKQLTNNQQTTNKQLTTIENNKNNKNNKNNNNNSSSSIYDFVEQNFGRTLNPIEYEEISNWEDNELTRYAIKLAVINGAVRLNYIRGILNTWKIKNIKTVQEAQKEMEEFKKSKTKKEDQQRRPTKKNAMDRFRETLDNWEKKMEEVENDNKGS